MWIKPLFNVLIVAIQVSLLTRVAVNKSSEEMLLLLLLATVPFSRDMLITLAEEKEKLFRKDKKQ
jgi:hypothetical protein